MNKKLVSIVMAAAMAVSLAACGNSGGNSGKADASAPVETGSAREETVTSDETGAGSSDFEGQTLVVGVWGGTWREAFDEACVKPFEEKYGVTIEEEEMGDNIVAQTLAQVQQDVDGIDMVAGCGNADFCMYLGEQGAIKELDYNKIPNAASMDEYAKTPYGVGMYICSENFTYDNSVYPEIPEGAAGFFDVEKYPGDRSLKSHSAGSGIVEAALLADGVAFEDLYPLDVDRAFAKLDTIKPYITKFWSSGSDIVQTINDKEATAGMYWLAHVNRAKESGADVTATMQDCAKFADAFGIVDNTKVEDLCYEFINYCISPEVQADLSLALGYAPISQEALQYLPEDMQKEFAPLYLSYEEGGTFWTDPTWWAEHEAEMTERYTIWISE